MTAPAPELAGTRFQTVPRLRRIQMLQLALKLIGIGVAAYVLDRVAFGRPLYPIPKVTSTLLIFCTVLLCRLHVSWGTALVFRASQIVFFRDSSVIYHIPRESVKSVQRKKDLLIFRYQADELSRVKVIGREGFSREVWTALGDYATSYVAPSTNA